MNEEYEPKRWSATVDLPICEWLDKQVDAALAEYIKTSELFLYPDGVLEWEADENEDGEHLRKYFKLEPMLHAMFEVFCCPEKLDDERVREMRDLRQILASAIDRIDTIIR